MLRAWPPGFQATGHLAPEGQAEPGTVMLAGMSLRIRLTLHRIKTSSLCCSVPCSSCGGWPGGQQLLGDSSWPCSPLVGSKPVWRCSLSRQRCCPSLAPLLPWGEGALFAGRHILSKVLISLVASIPATSQICILTWDHF